jgi:hypothetical protein
LYDNASGTASHVSLGLLSTIVKSKLTGAGGNEASAVIEFVMSGATKYGQSSEKIKNTFSNSDALNLLVIRK